MAALSWLHKNARSCGEDCQKPRESRNPSRATRRLKNNDNKSSREISLLRNKKFEINMFKQYEKLSRFANDLYSRRNDAGSSSISGDNQIVDNADEIVIGVLTRAYR